MNGETLKGIVLEVLTNIPNKPFLCLPMSAMLYAIIKDNFREDAKLATGDLIYTGEYIFKQDFCIADAPENRLQDWSGHAWVEFEDQICDLSFFRTLYSDKFTKPFKNELVSYFGEGRGCLITTRSQMQKFGLIYNTIDYLSDGLATGIIKGFEPILKAT